MLTAVPTTIRERVAKALNTELKNFSFCSGGCINHGGKLATQAGDYFLKWNDLKKFPGMFEAEAKGLKLLLKPSVIDVPEVVLVAADGTHQFIVMEFIAERSKAHTHWKHLGMQLAALHQNLSPSYGLDHDNYIGSLRQFNKPSQKWVDFFIEQRLEVQVKLASDNQKIDKNIINQFASIYKKLPGMLPEEPPSLLHGDLWSGNLITNAQGDPCLIDPAVYYGNRECELALTKLFGGFSEEFYDTYNNAFPLQSGFQIRFDVYNLYPLMVHVNLFGGGYLSQVVSILRHFV